MKEAIVKRDISIEIHDTPIPQPGEDQVLIKVVVSGSNPKDWKYPSYGAEMNAGDDIAGIVEAVGSKVLGFKKGDRVAAFHEMATPYGSFAQYAIAHSISTFHIPPSLSFEEASTLPLAIMTAALGIFASLKLPAPWDPPSPEPHPLIIYGGSTAVGAFAIKLAQYSRSIGPIIAVAGKGRDFVSSLGIPPEHIVDYRSNKVGEDLKRALGGKKCYHAFDGVSEKGSYVGVGEAIEEGGGIATVLPPGNDWPAHVEKCLTYVGTVHTGQFRDGKKVPELKDFGLVWFKWIERKLVEGTLKPHPHEVRGGLESLSSGLKDLRDGKASAVKYVYRFSDEQ